MTNEIPISWETFLRMAEASGLDVTDPHMEELYTYLQGVLPPLKAIQEIDLADADPATVYYPPWE